MLASCFDIKYWRIFTHEHRIPISILHIHHMPSIKNSRHFIHHCVCVCVCYPYRGVCRLGARAFLPLNVQRHHCVVYWILIMRMICTRWWASSILDFWRDSHVKFFFYRCWKFIYVLKYCCSYPLIFSLCIHFLFCPTIQHYVEKCLNLNVMNINSYNDMRASPFTLNAFFNSI